MILQIVLTLTIIFTLWVLNFCFFKAERNAKNYVREIEKLGYKAWKVPIGFMEHHYQVVVNKPKKIGDSLKIYREEYPKYDIVVGKIMDRVILDICNPDFIKSFHEVDKHYSYHKFSGIVMMLKKVIGDGLAFSEGQDWKRKRKILNAAFNYDFIKDKSEQIAVICDKSIEKMQKDSKKQQNGENIVEYDVLKMMVSVFSQVILTLFMGAGSHEKIDDIPVGLFYKDLLDLTTELMLKPQTIFYGKKLTDWGITKEYREMNQKNRKYRKWAINYIQRRKVQIQEKIKNNVYEKQKGTSDLLESLLRHQKQEQNKGECYANQHELLDQFSTFFFAAIDTSSILSTMMVYTIMKNPQIEAKLRKQINQFLSEDNYSFENLKNLKYLQNIQKQTIRMYGPANFLFVRQAQKDNYLNGLPVKKGTLLAITTHGNHFMQKYFKDPNTFNPDRWDTQTIQNPFAVGGFSAGARTCIGKNLAQLQSKIAVAKFFKRYEKVELGIQDFRMCFTLLPEPQAFKSKMTIKL